MFIFFSFWILTGTNHLMSVQQFEWHISVQLWQGRVLCRTLGLPEEQQQEQEEAPLAPQQGKLHHSSWRMEISSMNSMEDDVAHGSLRVWNMWHRAPTGPWTPWEFVNLRKEVTSGKSGNMESAWISIFHAETETLKLFWYLSYLTIMNRCYCLHVSLAVWHSTPKQVSIKPFIVFLYCQRR